MLSILPPLLAFGGFSSLLLRLTLGLVFVLWGHKAYKEYKIAKSNKKVAFYLFLDAVGILLIIGLLTQLATLVATIYLGIMVGHKIKAKAFLTDGVNYYLILLIISISLIFSGAGYFAFDLPL